MKSLLARLDLMNAAQRFKRCFAASREHNRLVAAALKKYGDHGSQISGVIRDHFPPRVKARLRNLCAHMNAESDAGFALRPRGVRKATMLRLYNAVRERDGSGFYH